MNCKNLIFMFFTIILNSCSLSQKEQVSEWFKDFDIKSITSDIKNIEYIDNSIVIEVPNIDCDKDYKIDYKTIFDSIYIVPLETTENSLIGKASKVLLNNDTIYIVDMRKAKTVKMFSIDGKYLGQIGTYGNGKGEYVEPTDIFIDSNITILDEFQRKLLIYNKNGEFIDDKKIPFIALGFSKLDNNTYIFRCTDSQNYHIPELLDYNLWITDSTFKIKYKGIYRKKGDWMPFINFNSLKYINNKYYLNDSFTDTIYQIIDEKHIYCPFVFDFKEHISFEGFHDVEKHKELSENENFYSLCEYLISDDYIFYSIIVKRYIYGFIYSKQSKKNICFTNLKLNKNTWFPFTLTNNTVHKNTFIGINDCYELLDNPNFKDFNKYVGGNYQNIKPDDNPVLIFYKMKEW